MNYSLSDAALVRIANAIAHDMDVEAGADSTTGDFPAAARNVEPSDVYKELDVFYDKILDSLRLRHDDDWIASNVYCPIQ